MVITEMSWLSDHLFGSTKPKDEPRNEVTALSSTDASAASEIQNDTITTSNAAAADESGSPMNETQREIAAEWQVPIQGKLYKVELEHGTTSGRRILWVDDKVCLFFSIRYFQYENPHLK